MATKANEIKFRAAMAAATDKYVKQQARNTIALNAESDGACAGYARIPGPDACDFCVTMGASNDFYHTKESAGGGIGHGSKDDAYHAHCNCQVVMVFEKRGRFVARDPETGEAVPYDGAELVRRYNEVGRPTYSGKGGTSYRSSSPRIIEKPLDYIRSAQTAEEVEVRFTEVYRQYKRMYGEERMQKYVQSARNVGQKRAKELKDAPLTRIVPNASGARIPAREEFARVIMDDIKRNGFDIEVGTEIALKAIEMAESDAVTLGSFRLVCFRSQPTVSELLEEQFHVHQIVRNDYGEVKELILQSYYREIDAQKYLMDAVKLYDIPENEVKQTSEALKKWMSKAARREQGLDESF